MNAAGSLRVLVTGGSGFIGTNLVDSLVRKGIPLLNLDPAPCLDRRHESFREALDILSGDALRRAVENFRPSHLVHLAARTSLEAGVDFQVNTLGTTRILEAAQASASLRRLLCFSSMLVCKPGYLPKDEQDVCPENEYGRSKVDLERRVRGFGLEKDWVLLRPTTIWGPWNVRVATEFYQRLRRGRYVHPFRGPCRRAYGFVGNVVDQVERLLEASASEVSGRTLYVGDAPLDLLDYVNGFALKLRGKSVPTIPAWTMKPAAWLGDALHAVGIRRYPLDSYRLSNMTQENPLDMSETLRIAGPPRFSLQEGIEATVAWLRSQPTLGFSD